MTRADRTTVASACTVVCWFAYHVAEPTALRRTVPLLTDALVFGTRTTVDRDAAAQVICPDEHHPGVNAVDDAPAHAGQESDDTPAEAGKCGGKGTVGKRRVRQSPPGKADHVGDDTEHRQC